jgi:hypothetical protein
MLMQMISPPGDDIAQVHAIAPVSFKANLQVRALSAPKA